MTGVEIAIATAAVSALGSVMGAVQGMQAASYNAALAERNAEIARRQGVLEQERIDRESRQRLGAITAGYGANNIVSGEGSPLDVLDYSFREGERDKQNAEYNAAIRASGYQAQASQARAEGQAALISGVMGVAQAGLGLAKSGLFSSKTAMPVNTTSAGRMDMLQPNAPKLRPGYGL